MFGASAHGPIDENKNARVFIVTKWTRSGRRSQRQKAERQEAERPEGGRTDVLTRRGGFPNPAHDDVFEFVRM